MRKKLSFLIFTIGLNLYPTADKEFCGTKNFSFSQGEEIAYNVYYSVIGIYVSAGTAVFSTSLEKLNNKPVYHLVGSGKSNSKYDWIFKVRDRYESYVDTNTLQPVRFIRNIEEGGYKKHENVTFNRQTNTAISTKGVYAVPECVHDVISATYYARNINFEKYKIGDKIPFSMFLDNEVYNMYIRYAGKETIKTRYGQFKCIKIKPLLLKGHVFDEGENMSMWISDDANHIPIRVETPILVGSIKIDLMSYKNIRHPLTSLIKWD